MGVKRKITEERKWRRCLRCSREFLSQSCANRICGECKPDVEIAAHGVEPASDVVWEADS